MAISDSIVDTTRLPPRKEKKFAVVAFFLLVLFGFGFMFAHFRPRSSSHSFHLNTVDDRAYDALLSPQVRNQLSSYVLLA
jgi:cytochrome b subunit of formate dehydrogenase